MALRIGNSSGGRLSVAQGPNFFQAAAGGLFLGLREDPLLRPVIDGLSSMVGFDESAISNLERLVNDDGTADIFRVIGEVAPFVAGGAGAFSIGRLGARAALKAVGSGAGVKAGSQLAQAAKRLGQVGTGLPGETVPITTLQRLTDIAGGSVSFGAFEGARSLAAGEDAQEAAKSAVIGAVLTATGEGALFGAARAFGIGKEFARGPIVDAARLAHTPNFITKIKAIDSKLVKQNEIVSELNKAASQERNLIDSGHRFLQEDLPGFEKPLSKSELRIRVEASKERGQKLREAQLGIKRLKTERAATMARFADDPTVPYASEKPFNPSGIGAFIANAAQQILRTPESLIGKAGVVGSNSIKAITRMEQETIAGTGVSNLFLVQRRAAMAKELGLTRGGKHSDKVWQDAWDSWEMGGEKGVQRWVAASHPKANAETLINNFTMIDKRNGVLAGRMEQLGIDAGFTGSELLEGGVAKFVPQMVRDMPLGDLERAMRAAKLSPRDTEEILKMLKPDGLAQFGNTTIQRMRRGSSRQKLAEGIPLESDPWAAQFSYMSGAHRRIAYGSRFGVNGELKKTIVKAIGDEGGSTQYFNTLFDSILGQKYRSAGLRQFADTVIGYEIASKLALAVIPNLSQGINTLMFAGFRNSMRGLTGALRNDTDTRQVLSSVALADTVVGGINREFQREITVAARSGVPLLDFAGNAGDLLAHNVLKWSGFSAVERWNRVMSGHTGLAVLRDTVAKATNGKLRGETLERARRQLRTLDIDLDSVMQGIKNGKIADPNLLVKGQIDIKNPAVRALQEIEARAAFRASQLTQFIPSASRRPLFWEHPIGRVMFQFKNFALGQARFLKDVTLKEAAAGNMKPMAYFLSIYPVAGELVKDVRTLAQGKGSRESEGAERLLEDMLAVGGLGLASDAFIQARWGKLMPFMAGPAVSDMTDVAEAMSRFDTAAVVDQAGRQPIVTGVKAAGALFGATFMTGLEIGNYIKDQVEQPKSFEEMQLNRVGDKQ